MKFYPAAFTALMWFLSSQLAVTAGTLNEISAAEREAGWKLLFDGKTSGGWRSFKKKTFPDKGWLVESGWLHCVAKGGGDIITDAEFEEFELQWEWKQAPKGNSGLKYFVTESRDAALGHEYQMVDEGDAPASKQLKGKYVTAAFYDVLKPDRPGPIRPAGEINYSRVIVRGNQVEHWLNGVKVLEYSCGSQAVKAAVAQSKFKNVADFGNKIKGHLLLQDHHTEAWFRNLKVREIKPN